MARWSITSPLITNALVALVSLVLLTSISVPSHVARADSGDEVWSGTEATVGRAVAIAESGIKANIVPVSGVGQAGVDRRYLLAGAYQYRSLWAWDFAFAARGALKIGEVEAVRDSLDIYFAFQKPDGLLPRVIDSESLSARVIWGVLRRQLAFKHPLKPQFVTENKVLSPLPNAVIPWAASQYIDWTEDRLFAEKWFDAAERSLGWIEANLFDEGLVSQAPYSDWEDSVAREGRVAFTNALYGASLRGLARWASFLGRSDKQHELEQKFVSFMARFEAFFWLPKRGVLLNFEGDGRLSADANLFVVAHGLVSPDKASRIMSALRASPLWQPIPGRPTWPEYPSTIKTPLPKLMGLTGYHDRLYWYWLSSLAVVAERNVGNVPGAQTLLQNISARIVKDGGVHEVYDLQRDGRTLKPVRRTLYRAEVPFTWSAGAFLDAAIERR